MQLNRSDEIYEFGPFRLSTLSWSLEYKGRLLHLARLDFMLLLTFLRQPHSILQQSTLVLHLWPDRQNRNQRVLQEHVYRVNRTLKIGSAKTRFIQHIRGQGYKFVCDVRRSST